MLPTWLVYETECTAKASGLVIAELVKMAMADSSGKGDAFVTALTIPFEKKYIIKVERVLDKDYPVDEKTVELREFRKEVYRQAELPEV